MPRKDRSLLISVFSQALVACVGGGGLLLSAPAAAIVSTSAHVLQSIMASEFLMIILEDIFKINSLKTLGS